MVWKTISRYYGYTDILPRRHSYGQFRINDNCYIRKDHKCGKMFGVSKSCFVACPNEDEINTMLLALLTEKLSKQGIETIIAVKERAYGQDIFCTKICGKIIEAKFCVVILDDKITKPTNIPNPNVYYEYGLMTSMKKHIIPLQKEGLNLAFNIQSYDTIKYESKNIDAELDRAIKDAIKLTDSKEKIDRTALVPEKTIFRKFELNGFDRKDRDWFLSDIIDDTEFVGFGHHERGFYMYLGKIDEDGDKRSYLEDLNVVTFRTEKVFDELENKSKKTKERLEDIVRRTNDFENNAKGSSISSAEYHYLTRQRDELSSEINSNENKLKMMSNFYIGFIFKSGYHDEGFISKANEIISRYNRFKIISNEENKINVSDIEINLSPDDF